MTKPIGAALAFLCLLVPPAFCQSPEGRSLTVHSASLAVKTDLGIGSLVYPDAYVNVFGIREGTTEDRIRDWLSFYTQFRVTWKADIVADLSLELAGFTPTVKDSQNPSWETRMEIGSWSRLLVVVCDADIQFDDPVGFCILSAQETGGREVWLDGIGSLKGQRIGRISLSVR